MGSGFSPAGCPGITIAIPEPAQAHSLFRRSRHRRRSLETRGVRRVVSKGASARRRQSVRHQEGAAVLERR